MLAIPASGIISGLLAGPLLGLQGRLTLAGWQWLYIIEGLPSIALGSLLLAVLTDRPEEARWLGDDEREWLLARLERERAACPGSGHVSFVRALREGRVWQLGLVWGGMYLVSIAYSYWAPQLIKPLFGWSAARIGTTVALISLATAVAILLNGAHSDRKGERRAHVGVPLIICATGWLLVSAQLSAPCTLLALAMAAISASSIFGPFWCLPASILTGEAAAAGFALINAIGAVGAFFGPNIVGVAQQWTGSTRVGFLLLSCIALAAGISAFHVGRPREPLVAR
jgi:ACS family tartrate transporter-like MFS transporter